MSPTLVVLAVILAISAFVLILFMMTKNSQQQKNPNSHANLGAKHPQKKKRHKS